MKPILHGPDEDLLNGNPLQRAAASGDIEKVRRLLGRDESPNEQRDYYCHSRMQTNEMRGQSYSGFRMCHAWLSVYLEKEKRGVVMIS